jgi:hypothetical protein
VVAWDGLSRKWVNQHTSGWINRVLNKRGGLNGSWVKPQRHYRHDAGRWPSAWKEFGDRLPPSMQKIDRIPDWLKASSASGFGGAVVSDEDK